MKRALNGLFVLAVVAFSLWLFLKDDAAQPGPLSVSHEEITGCEECHTPWRGVSDEKCLQCHEFGSRASLIPLIAFHEANEYCLKCHREHGGAAADISRMDHTLLNGELLCTQCHFDKHDGLFGRDCRACHGITTWKVEGYRHPPEGNRECARCHRAPRSHYEPEFWSRIEKGMSETSVSQKKCWECHRVHDWRHRKMGHAL